MQVGLLVTGTPAMRAAEGWTAFRAEWRDAFKTVSAAAGLRMAYFETFPSEHLPGTVLVRVLSAMTDKQLAAPAAAMVQAMRAP